MATSRLRRHLEKFQSDPHWRDLVLFHEYFHGDNGAGIGASHQTGWTGLVTKLMQQSGEAAARNLPHSRLRPAWRLGLSCPEFADTSFEPQGNARSFHK